MSNPESTLDVPNLNVTNVEIATLLTPSRLWTRAEVLARPCPVPATAGIYTWFFDSLAKGIPTEGTRALRRTRPALHRDFAKTPK